MRRKRGSPSRFHHKEEQHELGGSLLRQKIGIFHKEEEKKEGLPQRQGKDGRTAAHLAGGMTMNSPAKEKKTEHVQNT